MASSHLFFYPKSNGTKITRAPLSRGSSPQKFFKKNLKSGIIPVHLEYNILEIQIKRKKGNGKYEKLSKPYH